MKLKHTKILFISLLLAGGVFFFNTGSSHAATITVNSTADTNANDGSCTLNEAIIAVSTSTASGGAAGECAAGDESDDTIVLPADRIELVSHLPTLDKSVTIQGQGMHQSIVDGNSVAEIFRPIPGVSNLELTFQDLTIIGFERIAIDSQDSHTIVVRRVEIDGAGAVASSGILTAIGGGGPGSSLTVEDTYIHDMNGAGAQITAGIFSAASGSSGSPGELTVNRTTIARLTSTGSTVGVGVIAGFINGGLEGSANLNVMNTTINDISTTDNTFQTSAGGIVLSVMVDDSNSGEGVFNLNLRNNTLVDIEHGNNAGAEIQITAGAMGQDETITANVTAGNNILSSNSASGDCSVADITGGGGGAGLVDFNIISEGGNITAGSSCSSAFADSSDQNNVGDFNSTLGPLTNNGGYVPTMALLSGSPAIDAGVALGSVTTDARGLTRINQGAAYDSGAYELQSDPDSGSGGDSSGSDDQETLAETGQSTVLVGLLSAGAISSGLYMLRRRLRMLV